MRHSCRRLGPLPAAACACLRSTRLQDRSLRLWNPVKGLFIKEYRGHGYEVRDVSVCIDNSKMASVGGDRQVGVNPTGTAACDAWMMRRAMYSAWQAECAEHAAPRSAAVSRQLPHRGGRMQQRSLACCTRRAACSLGDSAVVSRQQRCVVREGSFGSLKQTPCVLTYLLVCLSAWPQVFLWDVASGGVIRKFKGHDSRINAVRALVSRVTECMPPGAWNMQTAAGGGAVM